MIYVRLVGGLGNQLFQYATARALALRLGVGVVPDLRELADGAAHAVYSLDQFAVQIEDPTGMPPPRGRTFPYVLWRMRLYPGPRFLRERRDGFDQRVMEAPDGTYLHGYFQSEAYFADQSDALRQDLRLVKAPQGENARLLGQLEGEENAVSLHVRRGDYLGEGKTFAQCDEAYYHRAVAEISARAGIAPKVYVFSNDPDWAQSHLDFGAEKVVVGHNSSLSASEDLRLMAACRHHVIANSSLSWWGAWLNPSPEKIIVAPRIWFNDPRLAHNEICPASWLRL